MDPSLRNYNESIKITAYMYENRSFRGKLDVKLRMGLLCVSELNIHSENGRLFSNKSRINFQPVPFATQTIPLQVKSLYLLVCP